MNPTKEEVLEAGSVTFKHHRATSVTMSLPTLNERKEKVRDQDGRVIDYPLNWSKGADLREDGFQGAHLSTDDANVKEHILNHPDFAMGAITVIIPKPSGLNTENVPIKATDGVVNEATTLQHVKDYLKENHSAPTKSLQTAATIKEYLTVLATEGVVLSFPNVDSLK